MKICTKCKKSKPESEFSKHKNTFDGLRCWCKECCNEENRKYRKGNNRNLSLLSKHNITEETYDEMLLKQQGKCAACGSKDPKSKWGVFSVDHDHSCCPTSNSCGLCIRGLLCFTCNAALGNVGDDQNTLLSLIDYLKNHPLPQNLSSSKEILLADKRKETDRRKIESAKKIGDSNRGKKKSFVGPRHAKPMSEEHRKKISESRLAYWEQIRKEKVLS